MELVLAIDLGTTGVRAVVYDPSGAALASAYAKLGMQVSEVGWISQDPEEMFSTSLALANEVSKKFSGSISALGISAQRGTAIAWDRVSGKALHSAVSWQDQRTLARVQELIAMGIPVNTLAGCTKFEWLIQNVPEVAAAASENRLAFGTPDAWLSACFSQQQALVTDCSNAGATGLYDPIQMQWFDMAMELFHQEPGWHMQIVATDAEVGVSDLLSCGKGVALTARAGDQQAACFAHALESSQAKLTLGTSGMLDVHCGETAPEEAPGTHALPLWHLKGQTQKFCLEGSILTAGASIEWAQRVGLMRDISELAELEWNPQPEVLFVPALSGLGTPYLAREARAQFSDLSLSSTRTDLLQGIIAGIAHRCADLVETLGSACGEERSGENQKVIDTLFIDGGLSQSNSLMQGIADFGNVVVKRSTVPEMTVLGSAMLAARQTSASVETKREYSEFTPAISADAREQQRKIWYAQIEAVC